MRSGKNRTSTSPPSMAADAASSVGASPTMSASAPQAAEQMANDPSAHTMCIDTARARTHGGELVCVAVLKVDITVIHDAPPITSAKYTAGGQRTSADTAITAAYTTQPAP